MAGTAIDQETLETFRRWRFLAMTPDRLLENYAARNNLTDKDVEQIKYIIRYAEQRVQFDGG